MSTLAVTPAASAAAATTVDTTERHAEFLPTDRNYRMTGELPAASGEKDDASQTSEKETKDNSSQDNSSEKVDASAAASDAEKAAASEAASAQKDKPATENRFQKLSRENKELRERLNRLESAQPRRDNPQASQPAADQKTDTAAAQPKAAPKPKIDDVDPKTSQPKYKTFAEYEEAKDEWNRKEAIREFQETTAKTQREQNLAHSKQVIAQEFGKRVEAARAKYADFDEVALNPDLPIKEGSPVDIFTLDSANGTDVLQFLGKNPGELDRINKLSPVAQIRELTKIELEVSKVAAKPAAAAAGENPSAKPVTQAGRPPHQLSGKGTVTKDAVEQAVEDGDQDTYMREQTARDLARRRKGK